MHPAISHNELTFTLWLHLSKFMDDLDLFFERFEVGV